jgi:S-formylglutathione hydrolase FrmB
MSIIERLKAYQPCLQPDVCIADRDAVDEAAEALVDMLRALKGAMDILGLAESNASGTHDWSYVGPRVAAARAAIAKAEGE